MGISFFGRVNKQMLGKYLKLEHSAGSTGSVRFSHKLEGFGNLQYVWFTAQRLSAEAPPMKGEPRVIVDLHRRQASLLRTAAPVLA
ncbi:hypothetical protein C1Y35_29200 [Pseudomonas sp. GW456-L14]|nr:hypothetical protein C1Y35_29200 [Pseudomonas sp. GW456-L14]PMY48965.1 hypothetical protein C1Y34_29160 [Pseudomonas sp. GW456-L12]